MFVSLASGRKKGVDGEDAARSGGWSRKGSDALTCGRSLVVLRAFSLDWWGQKLDCSGLKTPVGMKTSRHMFEQLQNFCCKEEQGWMEEREVNVGFGSSYLFLRYALLQYACLLLKHWEDGPRGEGFRVQRRGWSSVRTGTALLSRGRQTCSSLGWWESLWLLFWAK